MSKYWVEVREFAGNIVEVGLYYRRGWWWTDRALLYVYLPESLVTDESLQKMVETRSVGDDDGVRYRQERPYRLITNGRNVSLSIDHGYAGQSQRHYEAEDVVVGLLNIGSQRWMIHTALLGFTPVADLAEAQPGELRKTYG